MAGVCHHYKVIFYFRLSTVCLTVELSSSRGERPGGERAAANAARPGVHLGEEGRDNRVRSHRRRLLTSAPRCQRRHPPLPKATIGRRSAGACHPLRARTRRYPHLGASVYLTKVCCTWIAKLCHDNKTRTSILVCLIFDLGQRLRL